MSVALALDQLLHRFDFSGSQACRDDSRAAGLIIQVASGLGLTPAVVTRRRETHDSKCRAQRQDPPCTLDRSEDNPLGVTFWKSLVIDPDLRYSKHGDQEANDRSEQSRSTSEPFDLGGQLGIIIGSEIARGYVGRATVNPASNGRAWDVQLGEEIAVSGFANCLLNPVVVGPSRVESFHLERIGRRLRDGGADRKCPVLSRRCNCNASSPECHETQQGYRQDPNLTDHRASPRPYRDGSVDLEPHRSTPSSIILHLLGCGRRLPSWQSFPTRPSPHSRTSAERQDRTRAR